MAIEIIPYRREYGRDHFSCGHTSLNNYIQRNATKDVEARACTCFVIVDDNGRVIAYYTLSNETVPLDGAPTELRQKIKYDQIPVTLLGRLAVDEESQGTGLGKLLMADALKRCCNVAEEVGSKAVVVDPIDGTAVSFYTKFGFAVIPDSGRMFMTINKIREALKME